MVPYVDVFWPGVVNWVFGKFARALIVTEQSSSRVFTAQQFSFFKKVLNIDSLFAQIDKHAVEIFRAGMTYRQNAVM